MAFHLGSRALFLLVFAGCSSLAVDSTAAETAAARSGPAVTQSGPSFEGRVVETMNAGGYTYALLQTGAGQIWIAGPLTELSEGDVVTGANGLAMGNFHSPSLNRDFESIYFVTRFAREGDATRDSAVPDMTMPKGHPQVNEVAAPEIVAMPKGHPSVNELMAPEMAVMPEPTPEIEISLADAPSRTTAIADLFATKAALSGKVVTVAGEVVKFNQSIMGKNWIHLRDGSGDADAGTNDLLVTTNEIVKVGDRVKLSGIVALGKNLGAGYSYELLLENALLHRE